MDFTKLYKLPLETEKKWEFSQFDMISPIQSYTSSWEVPAIGTPVVTCGEKSTFTIVGSIQNNLIAVQVDGTIFCYAQDRLIGQIKSPEISGSLDLITSMQMVSFYMSFQISTCLMVGYSSGFVRIYEPNGSLVLQQQFHTCAIKSISIRTIIHPENDMDADEIIVLYQDKHIISIDAAGVWMNVKMMQTEGLFVFESTPLTFKKYSISNNDEEIFDCVGIGPKSNCTMQPCAFEGLTMDYYQIDYKNRFLCVGSSFVSMYVDDPNRASVARQVVATVSSAMNSAFSIAKTMWFQNEVNEVHKSKSKKLYKLLSLDDTQRTVNRIHLSPPNPLTGLSKYASMTDSLGRVLLFHIELGILIKMWKGCRDAQLGWIQTRDNDMYLLMLVIYLPRGFIEVYSIPFGERITSSGIDSGLTLFQSDCHVIGSMHAKEKNFMLTKCCLISPAGDVFSISFAKETLLLARPRQFLKLKEFISKLEKDNKDTFLLESIKAEVISFSYTIVQLKALEFFNATIPKEFYKNILELILTNTTEKHLESRMAILVECHLHFLSEFDRILDLAPVTCSAFPTWIHEIHVLKSKSSQETIAEHKTLLDYASFIKSFSPANATKSNNHKYMISESISESVRIQLANFLLYPVIHMGCSFAQVYKSLYIRQEDCMILSSTLLETEKFEEYSQKELSRIAMLLNDIIVGPEGSTPCQKSINLMKKLAFETSNPPLAHLCVVVLQQTCPFNNSEDCKEMYKAFKTKVEKILPLYYFLNGHCSIKANDFEMMESTSLSYILANYLLSNDHESLLNDVHINLGFQASPSIVYCYLLFMLYRKWDLYRNPLYIISMLDALKKVENSELLYCIVCVLEISFIIPTLAPLLSCLEQVHGSPSKNTLLRYTRLDNNMIMIFLEHCISILLMKGSHEHLEPKKVIYSLLPHEQNFFDNTLGDIMYILPKSISETNHCYLLAVLYVAFFILKHKMQGIYISHLFDDGVFVLIDPERDWKGYRRDQERQKFLLELGIFSDQDRNTMSKWFDQTSQ